MWSKSLRVVLEPWPCRAPGGTECVEERDCSGPGEDDVYTYRTVTIIDSGHSQQISPADECSPHCES